MASNPLLALLNFSGGRSSPSVATPPASSPETKQAKPTQLSLDDAAFGSNNASSNAANSLLQSLLSPSIAATPPNSSAVDVGQTATSLTARDGAAELLALLSPTQASTLATNGAQFTVSPPAPSQANTARSPVPTMFDQASPFDLLAQPSSGTPKKENGAVQQSKLPTNATTTSIKAPPAAKVAAQPVSNASTPSKRSTSVNPTSILQKSPVAPVNAIVPEYVSDSNLHALRHLAGLRASSGYDDESSSGLTERSATDAKHYTLDMLASQPAGPSTLYPAKLEIQPITILKNPQPQLPELETGSADRPCRAIWQWSTVVSTCEILVCYVTAKTKVRIIDLETGERALAASDAAIRSLFVNQAGQDRRQSLLLGVMTEKSIGIWSVGKNFGSDEQSPRLVAHLATGDATNASFVQASFRRSATSNTAQVIAVLSDGSAAVFNLSSLHVQAQATWQSSSKTVIAQPDSAKRTLLSLSQSDSGSLLAAVYASKDARSPFTVDLIPLSDTSSSGTLALTGKPATDVSIANVSFSALVDSKGDGTRALLLGFNRNSILAFVDLEEGTFRQTYRFDAGDKTQYNLATWHHATSTLLVFNSLRSSLFTLRPYGGDVPPLSVVSSDEEAVAHALRVEKGQPLDTGMQDIYRFESGQLTWTPIDNIRPVMKECGLSEVWKSFAVDDGQSATSAALHIAAVHSGGIQTIVLPEEVSRQQYPKRQAQKAAVPTPLQNTAAAQVKQENSSPSQTKVKQEKRGASTVQASAKAKAIQPTRQVETQNGARTAASSSIGADADSMRTLLAGLERNILSSISTIPRGESTRATAGQVRPAASDDDLGQSIARQLLPALKEQLNDAFRRDLAQSVADLVSQSLPTELQNVFMRPELNAHLTRSITASIVPAVQRTAMEVVTRAMAPHFEEVIGGLARKVETAVEQGMTGIRKDVVTEQSKALLESEAAIRDLARQMGQMSSMMEGLSRQNAKLERALNEVREEQKVIGLNSVRPQSVAADRASIPSSSTPFQRAPTSQAVVPPTAAPTQDPRDVEDTLIAALTNDSIDRDATPLQAALTRLDFAYGSAFAAVRSPQGQLRISQAVNLALLHRLVKTLQRFVQDGPTTPAGLAPELCVPWIEAACAACVRTDAQIAQAYGKIRGELFESLVQTHQSLSTSHRTPWWTRERFTEATLRYLQ